MEKDLGIEFIAKAQACIKKKKLRQQSFYQHKTDNMIWAVLYRFLHSKSDRVHLMPQALIQYQEQVRTPNMNPHVSLPCLWTAW